MSVFHWDGRALHETREGALARTVPYAEMIIEVRRGSERVRHGVGRVLRWLGATLMLSPVLILPKLLIPSSSRWISDAMTVGFVCVVVMFFATLNLYFMVSFVWWLRRGASGARFATAKEMRAPAVNPTGASVGARVSVEGVVVPIFPGDFVLRRVDLRSDELSFVAEASTFAVVPKNEGTPVIVSRNAIPWFDGEGQESDAPDALSITALALAPENALVRAERFELRAGDRVTLEGVVAKVIENADRFEVDGEGASLPHEGQENTPYRRGPGGIALLVGDGTPVVVTKR